MKFVRIFSFTIIGLYCLVLAILYGVQDRIVYLPTDLPLDHQYQFSQPFEEIFLTHPNGTRINALWFKTNKKSKGVVYYLHGNSRNLKHWGRFLRKFFIRDYDVFIIDYQGYGKSEGKPTENNLYADAQLGYDFIKEHFNSEDIIIYGRSIGTGPASHLAMNAAAKMLILVTPYHSIRDVVKTKAPFLFIPFKLPNAFPNHKHIPAITMPIHIAVAERDQIVPASSGEKLRPLLKPEDSFTIIEGGSHRNLVIKDKFEALLDMLL